MGATETLESVVGFVMLTTLAVAFWEVGEQMGSVSGMVQNALDDPAQTGLGTILFFWGIDAWCPVLDPAYLGPFSFISVFYPMSDGLLPHYSVEAALGSLVVTFILTWLVLRATDASFWGWGFLFAVIVFALSWYGFTLACWEVMFSGGEMIGLSRTQVFDLWRAAADHVQAPALQTLFVINIPASFWYLGRKFV